MQKDINRFSIRAEYSEKYELYGFCVYERTGNLSQIIKQSDYIFADDLSAIQAGSRIVSKLIHAKQRMAISPESMTGW